MQFERITSKMLKLPKIHIISRMLLIMFFVFAILGFVDFNGDELYIYQWALKNQGNFLVHKNVLENNHIPIYFANSYDNSVFFDVNNINNSFKDANLDANYSLKDFDIKWESGYEVFKNLQATRDVIVAIIDTGVDTEHFELKESLWTNYNEIPNNGIDDDMNGYVDDVHGYNFNSNNSNVNPEIITETHGTHAAGIMVASHNNGGVKGIAYDEHIKIMVLKVLDSNENGYMSSVIDAISYAKQNGASICNISLGTYSYDQSIDFVIKNNPDMLFVVASGNGMNFVGYSLDERDVYPAKLDYDNVITVSNSLFDGTRYISSNYGSYVDIFAPGTYILSTVPGNNFAYLTGTSMSSPFVAATCAMIYSRFSKIQISDLKKIVIDSATFVPQLYGLSKSNGMLNIYNSLLLASTY